MTRRTFAIGDIHGELDQLRALIAKLPPLDGDDSLVFLGDYLDRGPRSEEVVRVVRAFARELGCQVVALRGNHEDAWLRVIDRGWPEFVFPRPQRLPGDAALLHGRRAPEPRGDGAAGGARRALLGVVLPRRRGRLDARAALLARGRARHLRARGPAPRQRRRVPPSERGRSEDRAPLDAHGELLPRLPRQARHRRAHQDRDAAARALDLHPRRPDRHVGGECVVALDTGCGSQDGFLTALELPAMTVYESR
ncbi:MAG: metallophosphoesterase [Sandaracinaceae bacterium]|nr:metallophosphoesterase [Sandaracinaceae bacterium]